jgi:hypothetical protein
VTAGGTMTTHTHTNASSDGGSLDQNSLIFSSPLFAMVLT